MSLNLFMGKRRLAIMVGGLILILAAGILLQNAELPEPEHEGKKLSEWLSLSGGANNTGQSSREAQEAARAVRQIGANALPYLIHWIQYDVPFWRKKADPLIAKLPHRLQRAFMDKKLMKAAAASEGFKVLGRQASPAIPELSKIVNDGKSSNSRRLAVDALVDIGEEGVSPLITAISNPRTKERSYLIDSIRVLHDSGVDVRSALSVLLQFRNDRDARTATSAKLALNAMENEPSVLIPPLMEYAQGNNKIRRLAALEVLGRIGPYAQAAIPVVKTNLNLGDLELRLAATNALRKIAPELWVQPTLWQ
jgi:hypothetical protein